MSGKSSIAPNYASDPVEVYLSFLFPFPLFLICCCFIGKKVLKISIFQIVLSSIFPSQGKVSSNAAVANSGQTGTVEQKAETCLAEESHPSFSVTTSGVAVIVTQVSNDLIEDEEPPQVAEEDNDDVLIDFGGGDKPNDSGVDNTDDNRATGTGGGSVLVQAGSDLAEDSTEISM